MKHNTLLTDDFVRSNTNDLSMKSFNLNKTKVLQLIFIVRSEGILTGVGVYYLDDIKAVTADIEGVK